MLFIYLGKPKNIMPFLIIITPILARNRLAIFENISAPVFPSKGLMGWANKNTRPTIKILIKSAVIIIK